MSSSSIDANVVNEKEIEEPKEKEIEGTQKMIQEPKEKEIEKMIKERTEKGNWFVVRLPPGAQYVQIRAVMTLKATDANGDKEIQLDIEGKHDMGYTPWKLIKETDESKVWIHDEDKIDRRNKKEALEAEEAKQRIEITLSNWKQEENLIKAKDLKKTLRQV